MAHFDKLSVEQIFIFSEIIGESKLLQKEFIEKKFSKMAQNFSETVGFLEELDLIKISSNLIVLQPKFKLFLDSLTNTSQPKQMVKQFITKCVLNDKMSTSNYVTQFLSHFNFIDDHYEFMPNTSQRLEYSGLRNFLIDLEFLHLDYNETKYIIADDYALTFAEINVSRQVSPIEFLKTHQKRIEIGKAAELEIIEYEKKRLSKSPSLADKIEHTSIRDIAAGYDIKSFEEGLSGGQNPVPRFIEVKAVSYLDYRFNWTRNEMEKSKIYHKNYFLYLLPVGTGGTFNIEKLLIVNDPYSSVYKDESRWNRTDELMSFSLSISPLE
jgi:hypothetical protein